MSIYVGSESYGNFLEAPYNVKDLDEDELRQTNGEKVNRAALERIGSDGSIHSIDLDDEFNHEVALKSSLYSRAYVVFASYVTFCKEAVFGRSRLTQIPRDLDEVFYEEEYISGNRYQRFRNYNGSDFYIKEADPTFYERISKYVYSIYEWMVWRFYELFGIDD